LFRLIDPAVEIVEVRGGKRRLRAVRAAAAPADHRTTSRIIHSGLLPDLRNASITEPLRQLFLGAMEVAYRFFYGFLDSVSRSTLRSISRMAFGTHACFEAA